MPNSTFCILQDVNSGSRQIAGQGEQRDPFQIPDKVDSFQSHHDDSGNRTDDQHAATHSGAVGEELPEHAYAEDRQFLFCLQCLQQKAVAVFLKSVGRRHFAVQMAGYIVMEATIKMSLPPH